MIIGIGSGKGGQGKSTLSSNLAYFYSTKFKVLLLDADFGMSNDGTIFNVYPKFSIFDFLYNGKEWGEIKYKLKDNLDLISIGHGKREIADMTKEMQKKVIRELAKDVKQYDLILIDSSPGIHQNTIGFLRLCNKIVVLSDGTKLGLTDAYGLIKVLITQYKIKSEINFLFNMVKKRNVKKVVDFFNRLQNTCQAYLNHRVNYLGTIMYSDDIGKALDQDELFLKYYGHTKAGKQIKDVGVSLCPKMETM
jgi:flagellar biosynthesis protein FlhG